MSYDSDEPDSVKAARLKQFHEQNASFEKEWLWVVTELGYAPESIEAILIQIAMGCAYEAGRASVDKPTSPVET